MGTIQWARVAACVGCLALSVAVSASGQQVADKNNPVEWKKFGEKTIQNAPSYIKDASSLVKVQYLAMKVNDEVIRLKIKPNDSSLDRALTLGTDGTCGDLTNKMASALEGSGIAKAEDIGSLVGIRVETKLVSDPANWDHGAMVVLLDGRPFVFDLWMFANENGGLLAGSDAFNGFAGSKWNGIPAEEWGAELKNKGFRFFRIEDSDALRGTIDSAIRTLREISETKRLPGLVAIEEMSSPGPGDVKSFRAIIKNAPSFVEYPLSVTWTIDGRPASVVDPSVSAVLTVRSLSPGSHTLVAKVSFRNSSTGRTETHTAQRIFAIATAAAGRVLEGPKSVVQGSARYTNAVAQAVYTDSDGSGTTKMTLMRTDVIEGTNTGQSSWIMNSIAFVRESHYEGYRQAKWKRFGEGARNGVFSFDIAGTWGLPLPKECDGVAGTDPSRKLRGFVYIQGEKIDLCGQIDPVNGRAWGIAIGVPGFTWQLEWGKGGPEA
jgi:hypothetical protein